jgi:hypothetical protein
VPERCFRTGSRVTVDQSQESTMRARITDNSRFLGLDFADWSMLVVGFAFAGFIALYI